MNINKTWLRIASYLLMFFFIIIIIPLRLFPCFITGFLVYEIINYLTLLFKPLVGNERARIFVVVLITIFLVIAMTLSIISIIKFLTSDTQRVINISNEINYIFPYLKNIIPEYFRSFLPKNAENFKDQFIIFIRSHLMIIHSVGRLFLHNMITIFIGIVMGAIISLNKPSNCSTYFIQQLLERLQYFSQALRNIFFAQIKVSSINTILTSIMILVLFPLFNIILPWGKTLIIATFIFGMLPIIGNLISNCIIIISALYVSLIAGIIMVIYLILIHKLEYFLNADIVGNRIDAKPWELLLAMLIFEAIIGLEGLVVAPIYYAYIKTELKVQKLI